MRSRDFLPTSLTSSMKVAPFTVTMAVHLALVYPGLDIDGTEEAMIGHVSSTPGYIHIWNYVRKNIVYASYF